jgi:putative transposase
LQKQNRQARLSRKYRISPNTIYSWRSKHKGLSASQAKRLKVLEEENARLERLLAEKELEIQALTD